MTHGLLLSCYAVPFDKDRNTGCPGYTKPVGRRSEKFLREIRELATARKKLSRSRCLHLPGSWAAVHSLARKDAPRFQLTSFAAWPRDSQSGWTHLVSS